MNSREVEVSYRGYVFALPEDVSVRLKRLAELNGRTVEDEFLEGLKSAKTPVSPSFLPSRC